jgi:hypothetical protein
MITIIFLFANESVEFRYNDLTQQIERVKVKEKGRIAVYCRKNALDDYLTKEKGKKERFHGRGDK